MRLEVVRVRDPPTWALLRTLVGSLLNTYQIETDKARHQVWPDGLAPWTRIVEDTVTVTSMGTHHWLDLRQTGTAQSGGPIDPWPAITGHGSVARDRGRNCLKHRVQGGHGRG